MIATTINNSIRVKPLAFFNSKLRMRDPPSGSEFTAMPFDPTSSSNLGRYNLVAEVVPAPELHLAPAAILSRR
jgi:hypothetical protein